MKTVSSRRPAAAVRLVAPLALAAVAAVAATTVGCSRSERASAALDAPPAAALGAPVSSSGGANDAVHDQSVSASKDESARETPTGQAPPVAERRVIRKAELSLEADSPDQLRDALTSLAAARSGYVVGADTTRILGSDGAEIVQTTVTFRVPAAQFDATLRGIHGLARSVASEKVTGDDVTEEYVDLEARVRSQHALEDQYMTILKEAKSIPDILAVQQKLGEVRSDIERAEGRRRFLANQSDLSTFTVHVARHMAAPVPEEGPGFVRSMKAAASDAVSLSIAIVNGLIRALGVALPLLVIFVLPLYLALRFWWRRRRTAVTPVL